MYCPNCGARNDDDATRCANCGNVLPQIRPPTVDVPPQYGPQASVPNYLVPAILTTLFCCLPFGIVSIVYAAQVDSKVTAGDHAGALETSRKARMWAWISFGTGLVIIVFVIVINVIVAVLGADGGSRF